MTRRDRRQSNTDAELRSLAELADAVKASAERACDAIDDALDFIEASNKRIAAMEEARRDSNDSEDPTGTHDEQNA